MASTTKTAMELTEGQSNIKRAIDARCSVAGSSDPGVHGTFGKLKRKRREIGREQRSGQPPNS